MDSNRNHKATQGRLAASPPDLAPADYPGDDPQAWADAAAARDRKQPQKLASIRPDFQFNPIDLTMITSTDCREKWLASGIFVRNQPAVIGGPKKALKTSVALD